MKAVTLAAAMTGLLIGVATAQTQAPATGSAPDRTGSMTAPASPAGSGTTASDRAAASGDSNQAVATTGANAAEPAHGSNSFTEGQARSRIESNGYSDVSGLTKDDNGVWRGTARKGGQQAQVWLDYKGNVGQR